MNEITAAGVGVGAVATALFPDIWPLLAALAGGLTALSLPQYRTLSIGGRMMVVMVGFMFAVFVGPLLIRLIPGVKHEDADSQIVGALYYLFSISGYIALPKMVEKVSSWTGSSLGGLMKADTEPKP